MLKSSHFYSTLFCAAALFAPQSTIAQPPSLQVEVLDVTTMGEPRIDDLKIIELSGLAHDRESGLLYAVSDKSRLFSFDLDLTGDRIAALIPLSGHDLVDADGVRMRDADFNAEGMALAEDGTLAIISEDGPRIARFSRTGAWLEDLVVPLALRDPAAQRSKKDGPESLARHPRFDLLTAPEEPLEAEIRTTHTIYSSTGDNFAYDTAEIGTTSIKAMETLPDGRLLIIERDVSGSDDSLITWLRLIDPAACDPDALCATDVARIKIPGISDADFEGLAQLSDDLFMIVSDDKFGKDHRSVFGLLRVALPPLDRPSGE